MKRRKLLSGRSPVNEARVDIIDHAFSVNSRGRLASAVLGLLSLQCLVSVETLKVERKSLTMSHLKQRDCVNSVRHS